MAKNGKFAKYKKPFRLNIGLIIALILFAFIVFGVYSYMREDKVSFYEVTDGGIAANQEHTGIALRTEEVQAADQTGYVNLLITGGKRVGVGTDVYALDETGEMTRFLSSDSLQNLQFTEENFLKIKNRLSDFSAELTDEGFREIYDAKTTINSSIIELANIFGNDNLQEQMLAKGISFRRITSPYSGLISFDTDGFEGRTPESVVAADFVNENYQSSHTKSGQLVEKNQPVYRVVTSEEWNLVFPLTEEERKLFSGSTTLSIRFKKNDIRYTVPYMQVNASDGNAFGKLTLRKYMVDFINDRFINFDIEEDALTGLKIPKSAVVEKTFLTVPTEYLAHGGDSTGDGFYKEVNGENGMTVEYIETEIFHEENDRYYIDFSSNADFQPGDYVVKPGTNERYKLGETANLQGVYNINKGYAVFKQIDILDTNDEYYTVRKNQKYGLSVYDHILFDPKGINEGDFIYQ